MTAEEWILDQRRQYARRNVHRQKHPADILVDREMWDKLVDHLAHRAEVGYMGDSLFTYDTNLTFHRIPVMCEDYLPIAEEIK